MAQLRQDYQQFVNRDAEILIVGPDDQKAFVEYWEKIPLWDSQQSLPRTTKEALHKQRIQNNPIGLANSLKGMGTGVQPSLWNTLSTIQLPVHLIVGELDTKFVSIAQDMHTYLPESNLHVVTDAGHTAHLEQPEAFNETLVKILNANL